MSDHGGTSWRRGAGALSAGLALAGGLGGCEYEYDDELQQSAPVAVEESIRPPAPAYTVEPAILARQGRNFAELERLLGTPTDRVLLNDSGAVGGPSSGFTKAATVKRAGSYTLAAACVGVPDAQMYLQQDSRTAAKPLEIILDCSAVFSQVVELQPGYVSVHLLRHDPTGPWTGAVAGVRITAE